MQQSGWNKKNIITHYKIKTENYNIIYKLYICTCIVQDLETAHLDQFNSGRDIKALSKVIGGDGIADSRFWYVM